MYEFIEAQKRLAKIEAVKEENLFQPLPDFIKQIRKQIAEHNYGDDK